jgi:hypothetical protein
MVAGSKVMRFRRDTRPHVSTLCETFLESAFILCKDEP